MSFAARLVGGLVAAPVALLGTGVVTTAASNAAVSAAPGALARPAETFVPPPNGVLTFTGHGWGHGIGMAQWGAYGAALQGLSATQILDFYYPTTVATPIDPSTPVRVLLNTDDGADLTVSTVAANGAVSFTDVATQTVTPLPPTVGGAPVTAWRAALQPDGSVQLQGNWSGAFQPYPAGAPLAVHGIARFTTATGVVRLMNPSGTQDDERGSLDAVQFGGALRTVERVGIDDMLPGVLAKEMSASWPAAALQAQAVAARSYTDYQVNAHAAQPYDIAVPNDFAYEGVARYDSTGKLIANWYDANLVAAVHAFPGDVRTSNGRPIFAMFSSSDGGYTVAGTVAGAAVPYLIAKPDPYDAVAANSHHTWMTSVPVSTVDAAYPTIGTLTSIVINSRDGNGEWGGRIGSLTVYGTAGSVTDTGSAFANKVGLQSKWWNLPGNGDPTGALESALTAPGGARITGWADDPKTSDAILVHVYVDGHLVMATPANISRPDLGGQLTNGIAHGYSADVAIAPGAHTICTYAINSVAGQPNPQLGCAPVQAYAGNPIGSIGITPAIGGAQVTGWALDPESLGPINVRISVDGRTTATLAASSALDSVAAQFPLYGAAHGLSTLLAISGTHTVCATALNVGAGADAQLACVSVTVYAGTPIGYLDAVVPNPGSVALWGWSIDPDTVAPVPVHVYVDGQLVTGLAATQERPDVGAAFPVYGSGHGYAAIVPLAAGRHTVCAFALNIVGAGSNPQLGCKVVTVPSGDPVGHLDGVAYSGQVVAWGWAADPKVPTSPVLVHIYVDGVLTTLGPAQDSRPDVAAAFPSFGPDHGFFVAVPAKSGKHQVCAFAINSLAGGNNPLLGCVPVTVP
jgi:SpoIID/LytB domain protein